MRRFEKKSNIQKLNELNEKRYLFNKGLITENIDEAGIDELSPHTRTNAANAAHQQGRKAQADRISNTARDLNQRDNNANTKKVQDEMNAKVGMFYNKPFNIHLNGKVVQDSVEKVISTRGVYCILTVNNIAVTYNPADDSVTIGGMIGNFDRKAANTFSSIIKTLNPESQVNIQKSFGQIAGIHV